MALKFLNKKGWHTGSLRNIENVWKAEQKHDAEQKKLEELRKQIQEERERNDFRLLQEQAGLVPRQERLEFLYDSGLSVGKSSNSEGFKSLEQFPKSDATEPPLSSASKEGASVPGALFEDKPQSANDAWRKLHSDPLLMIRQREQEALAKIKNNPVKMAMIKKSIEGTERKEKAHNKKEKRKKHRSSKSKHKEQSDSEDDTTERRKSKHKKQSDSEDDTTERRKSKHKKQSDSEDDTTERRKSKYKKLSDSEDETTDRRKRKTGNVDSDRSRHNARSDSGHESSDGEKRRRKNNYEDKRYRERSPSHQWRQRNGKDYKEDAGDRYYNMSRSEKYASEGQSKVDAPKSGDRRFSEASSNRYSASSHERGSHYKRRNVAPKLTDEERAAKLRHMQLAAELHEEQRWKRIKKAEESDAQEAIENNKAGGKNFLDTAQKSVYGAAEGGSTSIAESVRRRTHYSQGRSGGEGNAFRR
ncbi:pre-mRNA-splicing factor CWC25 homolog [Cajanus cajan]|uniref:pre-mRNA-splicing factor CWC25 homolog n=1 Tax=Cajanus cajan TaxID=3821 RepID=UPI00098D9C77|nr:pre-mRNA-splicing factor CWC25 homolog [Cajanus cajan]